MSVRCPDDGRCWHHCTAGGPCWRQESGCAALTPSGTWPSDEAQVEPLSLADAPNYVGGGGGSAKRPAYTRTTLHVDGRIYVHGGPEDVPTLKFMAPGHFCPDVLDLQDLGEADFLRGRVIRAFMWLMEFWPKRRRDA